MSDIKSRAVGCDVGTMFFQTAEMDDNNQINTNTTSFARSHSDEAI